MQYVDGEGVEQDLHKGVRLLLKGDERGCKRCEGLLDRCWKEVHANADAVFQGWQEHVLLLQKLSMLVLSAYLIQVERTAFAVYILVFSAIFFEACASCRPNST